MQRKINGLYELYVRFMVWLGATPPSNYEHLLTTKPSTHQKNSLLSALLGFSKILGLLILLLGFIFSVRFCTSVLPETSFPLNLKWQTTLGNWTHVSPAYQNGLVIFPTYNLFSTEWYGIEATTGRIAWSQSGEGSDLIRCLTSEYMVISPDLPGRIMTLKTNTGEVSWIKDRSAAKACQESFVFARGTRGTYGVLDIATGHDLWWGIDPPSNYDYPLSNIKVSPTIVVDDTTYTSDTMKGVTALDQKTREVKWIYHPEHKVQGFPLLTLSSVAILDGIGYIITSDAALRAFDLQTGQELGYWQPKSFDLLKWPNCFMLPPLPGCILFQNQPDLGVSDNTLFVSFGDGILYAFTRDEQPYPRLIYEHQNFSWLTILLFVGILSGVVFLVTKGIFGTSVIMVIWSIIFFYVGFVVMGVAVWVLTQNGLIALFGANVVGLQFAAFGAMYGLVVVSRNSKKKVAKDILLQR